MILNNETALKFNAIFFCGILYLFSFQTASVRGIAAIIFFVCQFAYILIWGGVYRGTSDAILRFIPVQLVLMYGISLINNYELKQGNYGRLLYFTISIGFIIVAQLDTVWLGSFFRISAVMSSISVVFTFLDQIFVNLYDRFLTRLFPLYDDAIYDLNHTIGRSYNSGISVQSGINSLYITIGIGLIFISILKEIKLWKFVALGLFMTALFFTDKRGPILFTIISLLIVFYINMEGISKAFSRIYLTVIGIVSVIVMYFNFLSITSIFTDTATSGRVTLYRKAIELFLKKPWTGNGWLSYQYISGMVSRGNVMMTHSVYLQLLCETGIIGTVVFLTGFFMMLKVTLLDVRELKGIRNDFYYYDLFSVFGQVFFLTMSIFSNNLYDEVFRYFYVISCAIGVAIHRQFINFYPQELRISADDK